MDSINDYYNNIFFSAKNDLIMYINNNKNNIDEDFIYVLDKLIEYVNKINLDVDEDFIVDFFKFYYVFYNNFYRFFNNKFNIDDGFFNNCKFFIRFLFTFNFSKKVLLDYINDVSNISKFICSNYGMLCNKRNEFINNFLISIKDKVKDKNILEFIKQFFKSNKQYFMLRGQL